MLPVRLRGSIAWRAETILHKTSDVLSDTTCPACLRNQSMGSHEVRYYANVYIYIYMYIYIYIYIYICICDVNVRSTVNVHVLTQVYANA